MSIGVSHFLCFPKFKEVLIMPFKRAASPNEDAIRPLAEGWGKIVTRRAFGDDGPGLDLDFDTLEQVAVDAARAMIKGTIEQARRALKRRPVGVEAEPTPGPSRSGRA
jgi:hypothetical protein